MILINNYFIKREQKKRQTARVKQFFNYTFYFNFAFCSLTQFSYYKSQSHK